VDDQFKSDILLAMAVGFGFMMLFRLWPRIQSKMMGIPFVDAAAAKGMMDSSSDAMVLEIGRAHV